MEALNWLGFWALLIFAGNVYGPLLDQWISANEYRWLSEEKEY
jgi:hypothetical protein